MQAKSTSVRVSKMLPQGHHLYAPDDMSQAYINGGPDVTTNGSNDLTLDNTISALILPPTKQRFQGD
jgi:hypothetical protein